MSIRKEPPPPEAASRDPQVVEMTPEEFNRHCGQMGDLVPDAVVKLVTPGCSTSAPANSISDREVRHGDRCRSSHSLRCSTNADR